MRLKIAVGNDLLAEIQYGNMNVSRIDTDSGRVKSRFVDRQHSGSTAHFFLIGRRFDDQIGGQHVVNKTCNAGRTHAGHFCQIGSGNRCLVVKQIKNCQQIRQFHVGLILYQYLFIHDTTPFLVKIILHKNIVLVWEKYVNGNGFGESAQKTAKFFSLINNIGGVNH